MISHSDVHSATALKLYAAGLAKLHDPNWTGGDLYDEVKQHVRGRREPLDLLRRPLEEGVSFWIGRWVFDQYFSLEFAPAHLEDLGGEDQAWYLDDCVEFLEFHGIADSSDPPIHRIVDLLDTLNGLYEADTDSYKARVAELVEDREFFDLYDDVWTQHRRGIEALGERYAADFGNRVLHDRQLCAYIAQLLVTIGFDGDRDDGLGPRRWVDRKGWPSRVLRILRARDRGRCATCHEDLDHELDGDPHVDHIVPLAHGGCNDMVNLQVLCSRCNRGKGAEEEPVRSSVPIYIRRRR